MNIPKTLSWHARRTSVSIARAEALWRKAIQDTTDQTGWVGNAEYWGEAMHRFLEYLETEKALSCAPRVIPLIRSQRRILDASLSAVESICSVTSAYWKRRSEALRTTT